MKPCKLHKYAAKWRAEDVGVTIFWCGVCGTVLEESVYIDEIDRKQMCDEEWFEPSSLRDKEQG